jgi:hypothetical protein
MGAMSDGPLTVPPPPPLLSTPLVDPVLIPLALIERWNNLRLDHYLEVRLARNDLDHFFSAFEKCLNAQYESQECLIQYSRGNTAVADQHLQKSRALLSESQNAFRQAFMAIMVSATTPQTLR